MTGRDLISTSLRLIGAIAPGESIDASGAVDGLSSLNRMMDSWSNEGLFIHAVTQETPLTLTAGDATYTLGTSGDITNRPMSIERAVIRDGTTDYPIRRMLSVDEYASITNKSIQSTHPDSLYDDGGYPQRTITLYPVPSAATLLVLFTKRSLSQISTLDTSVSLPAGYERALVFNLAVELAPEYGRPALSEVVAIAQESKAAIKRSNNKSRYLKTDPALMQRGKRFDMITGGNT